MTITTFILNKSGLITLSALFKTIDNKQTICQLGITNLNMESPHGHWTAAFVDNSIK